MITSERADQSHVRLTHRLRDFLGIVPEDEPDHLDARDEHDRTPAPHADAPPERAVVVAVVPAEPEAEPQPEAEPGPVAKLEPAPPAPAPARRRPVAGPQTDAERADLRGIIAELRDTLDE